MGKQLRAAIVFLALIVGASSASHGNWDAPGKQRPSKKAAQHRPRSKSFHAHPPKGSKGQAAPEPSVKQLAPGRWRPDVAEALESLMAERGKDTEGYTRADPPVAAFALEDVSVTGSIAEALFYRLVTRAEFKFSEDFWAEVPPQYGAARIRGAYQNFQRQPRSSWPNDPYYRLYRKGMFHCQEAVCREWGAKRCAEWRVRLLTGFPEAELRPYIKATLEEEFQKPVGEEAIEEFSGDPAPVKVRTGLRRVSEMEDLFLRLKDRGFDVWVLSDAYQWAAEEFAKEYGVHPTRVQAVRAKITDDGLLTAQTLIPVPKGAGRAEAVTMFIGRPPALAVGDIGDRALLEYGRGLRVLFVDQDDAGGAGVVPSTGKSWLIQPRFSPERAPQETGHPVLPTPPPAGGETLGGGPPKT